VSIEKTIYTPHEFWEFVNLPQNDSKFFERINGEIVEVMPSNPYVSMIAGLILTAINNFLSGKNLGYATPSDGGYNISDEDTFAPDVAYISRARQAKLPKEGFNPIPPDLAVEVVSPSDLKNPEARIHAKLNKYLAAEIPLLWYVYVDRREVEIYVNGAHEKTLTLQDILDGGDVLPGFTLAVREIFPD
jgi:Uma2 family endonuclease